MVITSPAADTNKASLRQLRDIRRLILFFIIMLVLSGITAFPVEMELRWLLHFKNTLPDPLQFWLTKVYFAIKDTNSKYPFLMYGYDWLAFAHLVIALMFIGPYRQPVKNIWVIEWGMIACISVLPLAFIAGPFRGIPIYWQFIDTCFGIFGIIPLAVCYNRIKKLEKFQEK